jgi:hypothetical protein
VHPQIGQRPSRSPISGALASTRRRQSVQRRWRTSHRCERSVVVQTWLKARPARPLVPTPPGAALLGFGGQGLPPLCPPERKCHSGGEKSWAHRTHPQHSAFRPEDSDLRPGRRWDRRRVRLLTSPPSGSVSRPLGAQRSTVGRWT